MTKPNNQGKWYALNGIISTALGLVLSATAPLTPLDPVANRPWISLLLEVTAPYEVSQAKWRPQVGDKVVLDTQNNFGYIIHPDETYLSFPIVSGQKRYVCYIGLCYYAETPEEHWVMNSRHIKGDRVTYGPSGRFLRLWRDDGTEFSHYGIHEHRDEDEMFSSDMRYRSMGCIIVTTDIMDILDATYVLNEETGVEVRTVRGGEVVAMSD